VLERDDIHTSVEGAVSKGESGEIGDYVKVAVAPICIADSEIDANIPVAGEQCGVLALACSGIKHSSAGRERGSKAFHGTFNRGFEM
jgi:hypothetical protein